LIELFKIDMETQKDNPQGNASLAGAEFTWKYYAGFYNKDKLVNPKLYGRGYAIGDMWRFLKCWGRKKA